MSDLMSEFELFNQECSDSLSELDSSIDYDKYIEALNIQAARILGLDDQSYVVLKPVYLHVTKIHSLIFNVCMRGRRYSARLIRRISLGLRDRESEVWIDSIKKAYEIAVSLPPVGLDPTLELLPCWRSSNNKNRLRMTFQIEQSYIVINSTRIREASGNKNQLLEILYQLKQRGL